MVQRQEMVVSDLEDVDINNSKKIFSDRPRTNLLRIPEQRTITYLVKNMPSAITSNILTGIGFAGSVIVMAGFIFAKYFGPIYLLFCVFGFAINWFGDSLDGRIAYYRNIPRKWYGFSLDIIMDWIATVLIGLGYLFYAKDEYELIAYILVVLYGWAMIISQLRYKITNEYSIDSGKFGPTEIRVLLSLILLAEVFYPNTMQYSIGTICLILFVMNLLDTRKLLKLGNVRDRREKRIKLKSIKSRSIVDEVA